MPHLQTPRLQMGIFQTLMKVALIMLWAMKQKFHEKNRVVHSIVFVLFFCVNLNGDHAETE